MVAVETFQDLVYQGTVFIEGGSTNKYVVHIDEYFARFNEICEQVIHHSLKCGRGVGEAKNITSGSKTPRLVLNTAFHSSPV